MLNFLNFINKKIIVSDNGSTDNSLEWLRKNHPEIIILDNQKNLGWAEGNNVGIKYALNNNADYILLANNDLSFIDTTIISKLVITLEKNEKIGITGPKECSFYNPGKAVNEGWIMYPGSKFTFNIKRKNISIEKPFKIVDNVSGSFMLIKKEVFKSIGLMDEKLFLYAEDADFSLRAWKKGWISAIDPELSILHKVSSTSGHNSPLKIYYQTRNLIYLIRKHPEIQENHSYFIMKYYWDFLKSIVKIFFYKEFSGDRLLKAISSIRGMLHGAILNKMGNRF